VTGHGGATTAAQGGIELDASLLVAFNVDERRLEMLAQVIGRTPDNHNEHASGDL
jgi:hypothetical protein